MAGWLDKAKEAAVKATEEAKKLAETAKNADYGAMMDKTKNMATHAAEEAKKAASNIMKKEAPPTAADIVPEQDNPQTTQTTAPAPSPSQPTLVKPSAVSSTVPAPNNSAVLAKIAHVEQLLQEIKSLLK